MTGSGDSAPALRVVRGDATPEEIAALVAVIAATSAAAAAQAAAAATSRRVSRWGDRPALLRRPLSHGPGAWRASSRPG
jgi:hypothetical protein